MANEINLSLYGFNNEGGDMPWGRERISLADDRDKTMCCLNKFPGDGIRALGLMATFLVTKVLIPETYDHSVFATLKGKQAQ